MHSQTLRSISVFFLIMFTFLTVMLLLVSAGGVLWMGLAVMGCDAGCDFFGLAGASLVGFFPYGLVIATIVGWKTYYSGKYGVSLYITWGLALLWILVTIICFSLNTPHNVS